jgi:cytidyltransferase-like protein
LPCSPEWPVNRAGYGKPYPYKNAMRQVVTTGAFDQLGPRQVRFLEEASKLGDLHVLLRSDEVVRELTGDSPKFSEQERLYLISALRYVHDARLLHSISGPDGLPLIDDTQPDLWVSDEGGDTSETRKLAAKLDIEYRVLAERPVQDRVLPEQAHAGIGLGPVEGPESGNISGRKRVIVTGSFDWLHSGHVRFFEEAAALGDLYPVVGHDANIRLLKGEGHPLFPAAERLYMVAAIRYVKQALISSGHGWMDAEPEIALIRPDIYFVNEDGDKPEKRTFCEAHGIEFVVSRRVPKAGLPQRNSTELRGF